MRSAGLAVKALTQASSTDLPEGSTSLELQKKEFTEATTQYFALVSSIDVGLRQQIHALEEADIVPTEAATRESQVGSEETGASVAGKPPVTGRSAITGGGLGTLDIGWLNSRNDNVEKQMEAELWKKASTFLAGLEESKATGMEESESVDAV